MLREQDVIRNELLSRYEKRNEDMTKEVSKARLSVLWRCSELWCVCVSVQLDFYKEQNDALIRRLDEFETSCIMDSENISVNEPT